MLLPLYGKANEIAAYSGIERHNDFQINKNSIFTTPNDAEKKLTATWRNKRSFHNVYQRQFPPFLY